MIHNNLGSVKRLNKDYEGALLAYDKAISIDSEYHYAINNKAITLYEMGRFEEAIEIFRDVLKINKTYAYAYNNIGLCYYKLKDYDAAIDALINNWTFLGSIT
jgi:tetratricopeptide (TPR) repeat protein